VEQPVATAHRQDHRRDRRCDAGGECSGDVEDPQVLGPFAGVGEHVDDEGEVDGLWRLSRAVEVLTLGRTLNPAPSLRGVLRNFLTPERLSTSEPT
jgi:hypothetical protein